MAGNESQEFVYRISTADEWSELQTTNSTFGQQLDKDSGFIHLSNLNQVKSTLERFYLNTTDELFLLQIDCKKVEEAQGEKAAKQQMEWMRTRGVVLLGDGLIYEDVDGTNVFPHFYGPSKSFVPLNGQFTCSMLN
ncbi:hypothetical protein Hdeb2414_s0007g00236001 [Helianthus debilis subsp. tardiflorus]